MDTGALVLIVIVALTVAELAAVVVVALFGPHDQSTALIAILIGIVGPIVASFLAVWQATAARAHGQQVQGQVEHLQGSVDELKQQSVEAGPSKP